MLTPSVLTPDCVYAHTKRAHTRLCVCSHQAVLLLACSIAGRRPQIAASRFCHGTTRGAASSYTERERILDTGQTRV
eukprot:366486-Chlamydomonas_euryale.AAC.1